MIATAASPPSLARAVGHPLRVRLLAALDDGPRGLDALASALEIDRRAIARHARVLEQVGLIRITRSGRTTTYRLASVPTFSDDEYEAIPQASREAAVAATLAHCHTAAASALTSGGFDRPDIHLSRTALTINEAQWRQLSGDFAELLERVDAVRAQEPDESAPTTQANAVMMLFERSGTGGDHEAPHDDHEPFSIREGLERSWQLSEQLEAALNGTTTDWPAVIALAEQLRVLARTALAAEVGGSAATRRRPTEELARA